MDGGRRVMMRIEIGIVSFLVLFFVLFLVVGGLFGLLAGPELLVILVASIAGA